MRILMLTAIFLGALAGCQQSPIEEAESGIQQESPELQLLEHQALSEMGLTGPVEFVDLIHYPRMLCICWSRKGVLVDSEGIAVEFHHRSRMCPSGTGGVQWNCDGGCDGPSPEFVPDPEKNRAIGVLLGFWLVRELTDHEIAALPAFDDDCWPPFDRTARGSFVLSLQNDPAMVDLPTIIALSGPNTIVPADPDPRERGSGPLNSDRWGGASRRPNGTGVMHALLFGAAPPNRSFKLTDACSSRTPGVRPRSSAAA